MFKASIELGKVSSIKIKFGLIIEGDDDKKYNYNNKLINKFTLDGSTYLRVTPRPFITLDISNKKEENWSTNLFVNLNKISLYSFNRALSKMISQYKEIKDLYYYRNNKLVLNNEIASKIYKDVVATNNKRIRLLPAVVPDDSDPEKFYEGCIFCINSYDNFAYLSYSEMEFLLFELTHLDIDSLSMQLINTVIYLKDMESAELKKKDTNNVTVQEVIEDDVNEKSIIIKPEEDTIPDI